MQTDTPWKEVLDVFFPDFAKLLFPKLYAAVDWSRGFMPLDTELPSPNRDGAKGALIVDKLIRVYRRDGADMIVLVHVEIQAQQQSGFAYRMFVYHSRIVSKFREPVVSLAVLADSDPQWRPSAYEFDFGGCRIRLDFPVVKLLDYRDREEELVASANRFAIVIFAYLKAQECEHNTELLFKWKLELTKRFITLKPAERGRLLDFFDWVFPLTDELKNEFWSTLRESGEEESMAYVNSLERISIKKGREAGMQEGLQEGLQAGRLSNARESVLDALSIRFENVPDDVRGRVNSLDDIDTCKRLLRAAVQADSIETFEAKLVESA